MEYCAYGSIDSYLKNGNRLKEEELREIMGCCLLGLSYLHDRNVIHGVVDWSLYEDVGHQAGQSVHLRGWRDQVGQFRVGHSAEACILSEERGLWYLPVHGSRGV